MFTWCREVLFDYLKGRWNKEDIQKYDSESDFFLLVEEIKSSQISELLLVLVLATGACKVASWRGPIS